MATKNIDARIKNKRDTSANWEKNNPVLLNGEVIIIDTAAGEVRYKTGDGIKTYKQLPFNDEAIKAQIDNAVKKTGDTMTGDLVVGQASIQTNGYVNSTWLKTTANTHLSNPANKVAVLDPSGWVYHRTADEIRSDINALPNQTGKSGQLLGFTSDNVVGAVDMPKTGGSFYNSKFVGTLTPSNWVANGSNGYYQQFNIANMNSEQYPLVFPNWTSNKSLEQESWNMIDNGVESFNGYVRFYSNVKTKTSVGFTLLFGLMDSNLVTLVKEKIETTGIFIPG